MSFTFPFFNKKTQKSIYFGLYLTDATAFGFVFQVHENKPKIIAQSTHKLTSGFENILEDIDNLISELELTSKLQLNKTIFFLHSWMIDSETYEIKLPYKDIIKQISTELELEPLGYINVLEALEKYFSNKSVVNVIAVEVNKSKVGINILKGSKMIYSQYIARTVEVGDDLTVVFKDLPPHVRLPCILKIYGDEDKREISLKLAEYQWDSKIFSEHPNIEEIQQEEINQALAETFTNELSISGTREPDNTGSAENEKLNLKKSDAPIFGFVEGHDIREDGIQSQSLSSTTQEQISYLNNQNILIGVKGIFSKILYQFTRAGNNRKYFVIIAVGLLISILVILIYEFFIYKVNIKVFLKTIPIAKTFEINIPVRNQETESLEIVNRKIVKEYTNKKTTSGSKEVGNKATGTVVVHNFDNLERSFVKGSEISKGDLIFTLDSEVKVPSASGITLTGSKQSGQKSVNITAKEIGPEYNLQAQTQFKIVGLPESLFVAVSNNNFTGGTKKEVTTISKLDILALENEVVKQSKNDTTNILGAQTNSNEILLNDMTKSEISNLDFSGEVGEEAPVLSIKAKANVQYYSIDKDKLINELVKLLSQEVIENYEIKSSNISYSITDTKKQANTVQIKVKTSGIAEKKVDLDELKTTSRFSNINELENKLKQKYEIDSIEIENSGLGIPLISRYTPIFKKNIDIKTSIK